MELGVVFPIANGGHVLSEVSEHPLPTWDFLSSLALKAENLGFDYGFSQVTLRGFGGSTDHWDYQMDSLSLMAGLGAITKDLRLVGSIAIPTLHPAMAAKMVAGVAEVTGDRFDINLVTGWSKKQYDQMGLWPGDEYFGTRYDVAEEYATVMRELWETGTSSFQGKHYQLDDCQLGLLPDEPIGLICAGQSDRGLDFVATHGDYAYVLGTGDGPKGVAATLERLGQACQRAQRWVEAFHVVIVIIADTDEEAQAKAENYVANADYAAIADMQGLAALDSSSGTAARISDVRGATFQNLERVVGSPETVARYFDELAALDNLKGTFAIFDEAMTGVERFGKEVMPLMKSRQKVAR